MTPNFFDQSNTKNEETYVVQPVLPNPLLFNGSKFDLRLYVLVRS